MSGETKVQGPASYFPSMGKKYKKPMSHWFAIVGEKRGGKHIEIVNFSKSEHGNLEIAVPLLCKEL